MDGEGNSRSREAMEAARQFAAFAAAAAAAAAVPPPPQQAFYPSAAGMAHPWPPAFASDPAFAWFANLAAAAAAAQGGGGPGVSMPHVLPNTSASAIQQLPGTASASIAQLPSGGLPPYDRFQASRGWLQRMTPGSPWPLMLPSPHHSLMTPGIHWPLYRHGLSSAAASPFSSRGASPSEDYRTGQRPPASSSAAASGQRVNDAGDQPSLQEPLPFGSGRHAFRSAGLHAFVPYSRSNTSSPLANSTGGTDTCLDLSMPRTAGDRPRAPPSAARGAPSPPAPAEMEAPPTVPTSGASVMAASSGSTVGCSRTMPMKVEREGSSKRSSIPVGIAVAWQRRQDTDADLTTAMPKADAPGQQPVTATQSKAPVPGLGDGPPMPNQPGFLKVNAVGLENGSSAPSKPALLPPSLGLFGLPLSLALPAESVIKTNRTAPTTDHTREPIHDPLPRLHQHAGPAAVVSDAACIAAQHSPTAAIPKISVANGAESSATINVKTEDSSGTQATFPTQKPGTATQQQRAGEQAAGLRGISAVSSFIVPNAAASVLEGERVSADDADSCKSAANEGAPSSPLDPGSTAQCKDIVPSHRGNSKDAAVVAADLNTDATPDSGRVLRAAIRSRDAAKDGNGTAAAKQAASGTVDASAAAAGPISRSKSKGKASKNKKTAKKPANDGLDYSVIVYNGVKYHPLRDRELQALCKRLKERQRTLARSVRSYAGKIAKLDLMDELEEAPGDDDDGQPSAGPSTARGTANGSSADELAGPKEPAAVAAADGLTMPGVFGIASVGIGIGSSCHRDSRKSGNKRRDVDDRSPAATSASPTVTTAAVANGNAGEGNHEMSARCSTSGLSRVAAAAVASAASHIATVDLRVSADDLVEGARLLVFIRGLPHEATVVCIEPPSVYGVLLVGQRSARPRVYARDDLLRDAYRDVQPAGVDALSPGSRVCAYWSNQFGYLYPGVVTAMYNTEAATASAAATTAAAAATIPATGASMTGVASSYGGGIAIGSGHASSSCRSARGSIGSRSHTAAGAFMSAGPLPFVDITFDDGDSGKFPLEQIRLLPADFPHTPVPHQQGYDDDLSVVPVERRRSLSRTTSMTAASSSSAAPAAVRSPTSSSSDGLSPTKREYGAMSRRQPVCSVTSVCTATSSTAGCGGAAVADEGDVFEDSDDEPLHLYKVKRARESFMACDGDWVWSGQATRRRESSSGSSQGRQRHREIKDFYKEIRRGDETLKVGDCAVFVRREEDKPPYVGKILSMWQGRRSHRMVVKVQWFYHPEETSDFSERVAAAAGGAPDLCGALFESEHVDENSVQTISHRCRVLPMADYHKEGLHMRPLAELMEHTAFYIAGKYDAAHSQVVSFLSMSGMAATGTQVGE